MLEGPSYLVSRQLLNSCEQERKWVYSSFHAMEAANKNKHCLLAKKTCKEEEEEKEEALVDGENKKKHWHCNGEQLDSSSLIHQLGRDMSINCLLHCSRSEYGSIASLNRGFRSLFSTGELYRVRRQMGIVEHWVYFSCDLLEWDAYDPNANRWMRLPTITSNECFMSSDKESLAVGTELLVFGKEAFSQVIYKYSILDNRWSFAKNMETSRFLFGSASVGEIAILAGGCDSQGKVLDSAELYNSETGNWVALPKMHKARKMCSAVFLEGKFFVIGGMGPGNIPLTCGEEYNLKTGTWREIPNMYPEVGGINGGGGVIGAPPLVAVVKGNLYAVDYGRREVKRYIYEEKEEEEEELKENAIEWCRWAVVGRLPQRVVSTNGWGLAFKACGDRVMVLGGVKSLDGRVIEIYSWSPSSGAQGHLQWTVLGSWHLGNFVYNCAVMGC